MPVSYAAVTTLGTALACVSLPDGAGHCLRSTSQVLCASETLIERLGKHRDEKATLGVGH